MPEVIFIIRLVTLGFGNTVIDGKGTFTVNYARLRSQADLDGLLAGKTFAELGQGAIVEHGDIVAPDGTPLQMHDVGSAAISTLDEALQVAKAAKANPESVLHKLGFAETIPIYFLQQGKPAELQE